MQLLLVEDDDMVADGLVGALTRQHFTVNRVVDGSSALRIVKSETPDILILDLGLPDMDGLDVLREVKKHHPGLPVLVLTARDSLEQKVSGLDRGADDYLTKPFELDELIARLRVLERRLSIGGGAAIITIGTVTIDTSANIVKVNDTPLNLAKREYMLVKALAENVKKIHTRESLESKLYNWDEDIASNAIDVHIHNLRKKLPEGFIKTVRGIGYTINQP